LVCEVWETTWKLISLKYTSQSIAIMKIPSDRRTENIYPNDLFMVVNIAKMPQILPDSATWFKNENYKSVIALI